MYYDFVYFVICDVFDLLEVDWVDDFVIFVFFVIIKIFCLIIVIRVMEEKGVVRVSIFDELMYSF